MNSFYTDIIDGFNELTKSPTQFLELDEGFCNKVKIQLKQLYDTIKNVELKSSKTQSLNELIVDGFDIEQIWQQIELQNESFINPLLGVVSKLVVGKSGLMFVDKSEEQIEENEDKEESDIDIDPSLDDEEIEESSDEKISKNDSSSFKNQKSSVVDDDFFKLSEMQKFLQAEEKKINEVDSGNDSDESESEASVDLFEDNESDDSEDEAKQAKYKDFFKSNDNPKTKKFNEESSDDDQLQQSTFEQRQSRLNKKIEEIEEDLTGEKPWQLKGEITADKRPQNSLLEEVVDFDLTTRPAPVMTEQTTMQLEDIIKQRIKDKTFDSVERKAKPVETVFEYKKKLVLDQEKSKESLAQIYEREFLEQQAALDKDNTEKEEKEPELHKEINSMMKDLFIKLDALSNFHFTPKVAVPDLKIVSNLPAIAMEEVAPVAMSDANLLAPEEVKAKPKGDLMGKNERTATDKKRERRKKKIKQKIHAKEKQKKDQSVGKKVLKGPNIIKSKESQGIKSSKAFFTQLQEEVKSQVKRKSSENVSKKRNELRAKRLKL